MPRPSRTGGPAVPGAAPAVPGTDPAGPGRGRAVADPGSDRSGSRAFGRSRSRNRPEAKRR
ncbi:hypothetical protein ATKI12_7212 [Kitasatospora sp. Ki12]